MGLGPGFGALRQVEAQAPNFFVGKIKAVMQNLVQFGAVVLLAQIADDSVPNPAYLTGIKRAVYEFLNDFLPVNQAIQCAGMGITNPLRFALCDLGISLASIFAGLGLFARKDLK